MKPPQESAEGAEDCKWALSAATELSCHDATTRRQEEACVSGASLAAQQRREGMPGPNPAPAVVVLSKAVPV